MAHFFHPQDVHAQDWRPVRPRARALRLAGQGAELLILLMLAGLVALWVTGAPIHSLLPIDPPA